MRSDTCGLRLEKAKQPHLVFLYWLLYSLSLVNPVDGNSLWENALTSAYLCGKRKIRGGHR